MSSSKSNRDYHDEKSLKKEKIKPGLRLCNLKEEPIKTIRALQNLPRLFRYADVAKYSANPNVFLTRALKQEFVSRILKGFYINRLLTGRNVLRIEEVACFLRNPAYVSCEWALNYHGVILQSPTVCTTITLSPSVGERNKVSYMGTTIEYSKISESLFWGFVNEGGFNMAGPEKALMDMLYLRKKVSFKSEFEMERINRKKIATIAEKYPQSTRKLLEEVAQTEGSMTGQFLRDIL
jgi:hypothetical protein